MGSPFFRTRSAPKANCARGVMDLNSEGLSLQDDDSGYSPERVLSPSGDVSASVDVDASLQSAWQSLQDRGPQQIWEDGFWSQVFGNQSQAFLAPAFTQFDRPMQIGSFAEIPEDESSVLADAQETAHSHRFIIAGCEEGQADFMAR